MKKFITTFVKIGVISILITSALLSQTLQQYSKTVVNGKTKWTFNTHYHSVFDVKKPVQRQNNLQNLLNQKSNPSSTNSLEDRWNLQLPYPTDKALLFTEAENDLIISAGYGFSGSDIITSTDKGENWEVQQFGADTFVTSVNRRDNLTWMSKVMVDESGQFNSTILKSTDLGKNWTLVISIDSFAVIYLNMIDNNNGIALSILETNQSTIIKLLKTTDSGNSWSFKYSEINGWITGFKSIHFTTIDTGYICTEDPYPSVLSRILMTTNGGSSWQTALVDTISLYTIKFYDSKLGWVLGNKFSGWQSYLVLCYTTDSGNNWSEQNLLEGIYYGSDISILDSLTMYLVISDFQYLTTIYKTTDGFNTLNALSQIEGIDISMGCVKFISDIEGWITGNLGSIYYTSDGGYNWLQKNKFATMHDLHSVDFVNSNKGWAASSSYPYEENVLLETNNGGDDWSVIKSDTAEMFQDIDLINNETGFLITNDVFSYPVQSSLFSTYDDGLTWDDTTFDNITLGDIFFVDQSNGWIVGDKNYNPFIIHTSNSGTNWYEQTNINFTGLGLTNVYFANTTHGFAVGDFGIVLKTTNGGNSWRTSWGNLDPNLFWSNYNLTGVFMLSPSSCWIAGNDRNSGWITMLMHTTNGGTHWDTVSISSGNIQQIVFLNESEGYCIGNYISYATTDGGSSWSQINYPIPVNRMFFLNENLGWAVGNDGRIFKYSSSPVFVDDQKDIHYPRTYTLYQNYPNPFNPSTKIKFTVPSVSSSSMKLIKLMVYDVLGNEVATLVNEEKLPGTYEVTFDASRLASGVYFYRLITDNFAETKKMILMR